MNIKTLLAVIIFAQGCATVHHGRHQTVSVATDPAGATVEVHCGKPQRAAVTPTTVRLLRRAEPCSLTLTRPGFRSETVVFDSSVNGWFFGNFAGPIIGGGLGATRQSDQAFIDFLGGALFGGIGFAVDAITGAMWHLEPSSVDRKLIPQ